MLSIYNKVSDYIIVVNYDGKIIFINESFLNRLNYKKKDILNLHIFEFIKNRENSDKKNVTELKEIDTNIYFYSKSNELIKINSNISIQNFNNEKNIVIIGKEVDEKLYTMEMLEDILDNINISTFISDEQGKFLYVNKKFANMLNLTRNDIIGTCNEDYWNYEICKELELNNLDILHNKKPKIFNEKLVDNDEIQWYKSYKSPIYDKDSKYKYMVAMTENINLPKIISEELYNNFNSTIIKNDYNETGNYNIDLEKILNNIGNHILDYTQADGLSILLHDNDKQGLIPFLKLRHAKKYLDNIDFIPNTIEQIYEDKYNNYFNNIYPKSKIINEQICKQISIDELSYLGNYIVELNDEFIGMLNLSYSNGNCPKFNSDEYMKEICSNIAMIIKNVRLSNQVFMENKMRKDTEKELEQYLNVSVDLVSIVGIDGYLKRLSPNWHNVLGWSESELLSMPMEKIVHPEEVKEFRKLNKVQLIGADGKIDRRTIRFKHKKGHDVYLEWSSMYIDNRQLYVTAARDITGELEIEKEKIRLEEAVQLEIVKNEFFSNISHEFRTPINILIGTMQLINKNIDQNNIDILSLKKYTNYIKQNSYRLLRLVNNLIDITKMDIGVYKIRASNQNIINIIEDITLSVADYTKNNKINLIFDTNVEELITSCDPDKIERIMLNLLSNAIKYTPEDGNIQVDINVSENDIIVSVKDSGVGIPSDKLDLIFDRFGQVDESLNRKCEGSGIGLSIVKNLVEMHGGNVYVKSVINEGTQFVFTIPIKLKEQHTNDYNYDGKCKHVERCDIEFSDIYSV